MPIPDYQTVMLPLLKYVSDGKVHRMKDAHMAMCNHFALSPEEMEERIPSGGLKMYDRVIWAKTYMKEAGLLANPERGSFQITDRGREVLAKNPPEIDLTLLRQFPEFVEFVGGKNTSDKTLKQEDFGAIKSISEATPQELYETAYRQLRRQVESDLLERVKSNSPQYFEDMVLKLLRAMGYGDSVPNAGKRTGKPGDSGVDGVIKEDSLGLSLLFIQAKRYTVGSIGRPEIQGFVGALQGADKGVFFTTSTFTKEAVDYAAKVSGKKIILIDGKRLAELMYEHGVGVSNAQNFNFVIKTIDSTFFDEESTAIGNE